MPEITKNHVDFARGLVNLAREHGVNHIEMTFDMRSCKEYQLGSWPQQKLTIRWQEGRHGAEKDISIHAEENCHVTEKHPLTPQGDLDD